MYSAILRKVATLVYREEELDQKVVYLAWRDGLGACDVTLRALERAGDAAMKAARFLRRLSW